MAKGMWVTAQIDEPLPSPKELERDRLEGLRRAIAHGSKSSNVSSRQLDRMVDRVEDIVIQLRQQDHLERLQRLDE